MAKSLQEMNAECALLRIKLIMSENALEFVCKSAANYPEAAEFIADGLPFWVKGWLDDMEKLMEGVASGEEVREYALNLFADMRDDLGFPIK